MNTDAHGYFFSKEQELFEIQGGSGEVVGQYVADLVIEDRVAVEVKTVRALDSVHEAQCLNYLKCSGLRICLLVNFARPRLQFKRIVLG